jgi:hypothetical protein
VTPTYKEAVMKRLILAAAALATLTGATLAATAAGPRSDDTLPLSEIEASIEAGVDERLRLLLPELRASR